MYKLKLIKGLSYRGGNDGKVKVTRDKPFCVVENVEEAEALLASGHFQMVELPKVKDLGNGDVKFGEQGIQFTVENKSISNMVKDELIAFAKEKGIDISECKNNDERKTTIKKALEEAEAEGEDSKTKTDEEDFKENEGTKVPFVEE